MSQVIITPDEENIYYPRKHRLFSVLLDKTTTDTQYNYIDSLSTQLGEAHNLIDDNASLDNARNIGVTQVAYDETTDDYGFVKEVFVGNAGIINDIGLLKGIAETRTSDRDNISDEVVGSEFSIPTTGSMDSFENQFIKNLEARVKARLDTMLRFRQRFYDDQYCAVALMNYTTSTGRTKINSFSTETDIGGVFQVKTELDDLECALIIRETPIFYRKTKTSNGYYLYTFPQYLFEKIESYNAINRIEFYTNRDYTATTSELSAEKSKIEAIYFVSNKLFYGDDESKDTVEKSEYKYSLANSNIINYRKTNQR